MFTGIGLIAFCCIFGSALVGFAVAPRLPEDCRTDATQKVVQSAMNVVGLLSALVLGLLIAGTKANFDTRNGEVQQFASNLTLLDRELSLSQPEAKDLRGALRAFTTRKMALTWPADHKAPVMHDAETVRILDDIQQKIRASEPQTASQREGRSDALQLIGELKRTSRLLAVQQTIRAPLLFLVVVIFWLSMLFLSHALFAPFNRVAAAALLIGAFSVSLAVNLIFDMDQPFVGFISISPAPIQQAVDQMIE
jgi:Protein of unknown function (DUF4239)